MADTLTDKQGEVLEFLAQRKGKWTHLNELKAKFPNTTLAEDVLALLQQELCVEHSEKLDTFQVTLQGVGVAEERQDAANEKKGKADAAGDRGAKTSRP